MAEQNRNPEQKARDSIDAMLEQSGWRVQSKKKIDFSAGFGIAVREYQTDVGPADYVLFIDKMPVGVIEAKTEDWGQKITTGSGKTYTPITFISRLLKFVNAKRILFLVDTKNLGEQAEQEFMAYVPSDDNRKFTELYNVQRLKSSFVAKDSQVCISTIQRMYALLKDEPLDEAAEEANPAELMVRPKQALPVVYNKKIPPEFFDFIIIDECHRSIYNLWRQVLEYFDAFLIGLTATPSAQTIGFFNGNLVMEYSHEQAVLDGVTVGYDVHRI